MADIGRWVEDGCGLGVPGDRLDEMLHHVAWARQKCETFVGREDLLSRAMEAILRPSQPTPAAKPSADYHGISLSLVGRSGTGKTALMAYLAHQLHNHELQNKLQQEARPVVIRFCGTSKGSADGLSLVRSLCEQIRLVVKPHTPYTSVPETYDAAVQLLHNLLATHSVLLLIDSLDQLSDKDLARSKVSFLKGVRVHQDTRIVVSCLPDDLKTTMIKNGLRTYFYGCDTCLRLHHVPRVDVLDFSFSQEAAHNEARVILEERFRRKHRTLTPEQFDYVMIKAAQEPTALYLSLVDYVATAWHSFGTNYELNGGVAGIADQIFEKLERNFGRELTRAALGFITWSVQGVTDVEMEDLLSLHDSVLTAVLKYCPGVTRLPSHVWLRLRAAMEGLLVEGGNGLLRWYHRQLWEAAEQRYSDLTEKTKIHVTLGRYFSNNIPDAEVRQKLIQRQPITLAAEDTRMVRLSNGELIELGHPVWTAPPALINQRRAYEAATHLIEADLLSEAAAELCCIETTCGRFKAGIGSDSVASLSRLCLKLQNRSKAEGKDWTLDVEHYWRWLLLKASRMQLDPRMILGEALAQAFPSVVRKDAGRIWNPAPETSSILVKCKVLCGKSDFDEQLSLLDHSRAGKVFALDWCPENKRVASGSEDGVVRVWSVATGAVTSILEGHAATVTSVSWCPDAMRLASGSIDKSVRVWDIETGAAILVLEGGTDAITAVKWSPNSQRIASASVNGKVYLWDSTLGDLISELAGHSGAVTCVDWSRDSGVLVSGARDRTVRLWDAETGKSPLLFEGHSGDVLSVALSHDGTRIASGSTDQTCLVWDTNTGAVITVLGSEADQNAHTDAVCAVNWGADSTRLVTGSEDKTSIVWSLLNSTSIEAKLLGHAAGVTSVSWSRDFKRMASGSTDKSVRIWVTETGLTHVCD